MRRQLLVASLLAGAAIAASGTVALAADEMMAPKPAKGWYIGGALGANQTRDSDFSGGVINTSADFDWNAAGLAAIGFAFESPLRAEAELSYRSNDVDSIGGVSGSGDAKAIGGMLNLLYDIDTGSAFTPYLGAGIGAARVKADGYSPVATTSINDSDTSYALQGIAGVAYALTNQLSLTLDYRYFTAPDLNYTAANGTSVDADYDNHTIMVGLRFALNPPPPPPPAAKPVAQPAPPPPPPAPAPAPMPEPARNYLVFFDWDKADLTPEATAIIRDAATAAGKLKSVRIDATGHADRSGPARYNMGLSQRRAAAVQAELVRLGVPVNEIAIYAMGETDPLVPTPDGVREPQNRRVQIVLN